jgi:hypothetical protein
MDFDLIGQFKTKGNLIATDPCYEINEWCNQHFKVKPGTYDVYVVTGQLIEPAFAWDEDNFRVAELVILKNDYRGKLDFKQMKTSIAIDSGQCGFLNKESYNKKSVTPYLQTGYVLSFMKNHIYSKKNEIKNNNKVLQEKDLDEVYVKLKAECFNNSDEKTQEWFKQENERNEFAIERMTKFLETKTAPPYLQPKLTTDFYEIMCDLTRQEINAGVLDPYGAVSCSGLGDGSAELFVAEDESGEVVGAYLSYLSLDELK